MENTRGANLGYPQLNALPPLAMQPQLVVSVVIPVFQDSARAIALVNALKKQHLPSHVSTEIIVVDDASGDGTAGELRLALGRDVILHELEANRGRAGARNFGATLASGDLILFIDCDCLPANDTFLAAHLSQWSADVVASTGEVTGKGEGFWDRYQSEASDRRARQHRDGMRYSGSSQNMMVSRRLFDRSGGFDESYRTYGFEDRDFLLRLSLEGQIGWASGATVRHMDALTLSQVCRKMREAGGPAARLFSERHPRAYRALGYAKLDCRQNPWLRAPVLALGRFVPQAARVFDAYIDSPCLPYKLKQLVVRAFTGLSYSMGTTAR